MVASEAPLPQPDVELKSQRADVEVKLPGSDLENQLSALPQIQ